MNYLRWLSVFCSHDTIAGWANGRAYHILAQKVLTNLDITSAIVERSEWLAERVCNVRSL